MAEWLHEAGIGEERAILVEHGAIVAARVEWGEPVRAGLVAEARLISKSGGARRGLARLEDGSEVLVDALPREVNEGDTLRLRIVRAALAERGRTKRAQARHDPAAELAPASSLLDELRRGPFPVRAVRIEGTDFADYGWEELVEQALTGDIPFAGGSLSLSPTPAMTLLDVDGYGPPVALAHAAVPTIAAALRRLDLGGSVGIDFPSLAEKRDRQAVDSALGEALTDWRGERTAMNGFGFVQLVSRLERPSLVVRYGHKVEAQARILLRQAERVSEPGTLFLTAPPAVRRAVLPAWRDELARRSGRRIEWREVAGLAAEAAFAQAVPS